MVRVCFESIMSMEVLTGHMEYYEVHQCDEFCPFYDKDVHVYGRDSRTYECCILLGYDYSEPKQVLVRLWAGRRREVEDNYKHVRIVDRPDIDEVFHLFPFSGQSKNGPVVVRFQPVKWRRWEGKASLYNHYGDSPVGRIKKRVQAEEDQRKKDKERRKQEKEIK